eukprot:3755074-Pyramimonas_sp.AAC.1
MAAAASFNSLDTSSLVRRSASRSLAVVLAAARAEHGCLGIASNVVAGRFPVEAQEFFAPRRSRLGWRRAGNSGAARRCPGAGAASGGAGATHVARGQARPLRARQRRRSSAGCRRSPARPAL